MYLREGKGSRGRTWAELPGCGGAGGEQRRVGIVSPRKDGVMEDGRQGWYLIGGVGVPHDQLPILRGTY